MLYITPYSKPKQPFQNDQDAVFFLASNTVASYSGQPIRPRGPYQPTYNVSEVCCWLSEQPLRNGMRLCTLNNGSSQIALIPHPVPEGEDEKEDANEHMDVEKEMPPLVPDNLLLISVDCYEGLKRSLAYLNAEGSQKLIKDPTSPLLFVTDPKNPEHYIWPTRLYDLPDKPTSKLTSQDCFIYTKKMALVQYLSEKKLEGDKDDNGIEVKKQGKPTQVDVETSREFLFVEANPLLPDSLYVKAQNTIRLFQLNGRHYDYVSNRRYHYIGYNTSNKENEYDDLRPEGRIQAFTRARKSLSQLRTMQTFMVDAETLQTFISQYKILIELTGYPSIWATVFNDGEDPGRFNDIIGVPAPSAPLIPDLIPDTGGKRKREEEEEQDILDVTNTTRMTNITMDELERFKKKRKLNDKEDEEMKLDIEEIVKNLITVSRNPKLWKPRGKSFKGSLPCQALDPEPVVEIILNNALQCSQEYFAGFSREFSRSFTFSNAPFGF